MGEPAVGHGWERHFYVSGRMKGGRCDESRGSGVVADVIWNTRGSKGACFLSDTRGKVMTVMTDSSLQQGPMSRLLRIPAIALSRPFQSSNNRAIPIPPSRIPRRVAYSTRHSTTSIMPSSIKYITADEAVKVSLHPGSQAPGILTKIANPSLFQIDQELMSDDGAFSLDQVRYHCTSTAYQESAERVIHTLYSSWSLQVLHVRKRSREPSRQRPTAECSSSSVRGIR